MGMLELFREWQNSGSKRFRPRRRRGLERTEVLELRQMLSSVLIGTTVRIDGSAGVDTVTILQNSTGVTITENGNTTAFASSKTVNSIYFFGGVGTDQVTIIGVLPGTSLGVYGGSGSNNTLISPNSDNLWKITGPNSGTFNGNPFTNMQNLVGGSYNDTFQFGPSGFVSGTIKGGSGIDTLDYSPRTAGVVVNLAKGSASAIGSGFSQISALIGSSNPTNTLIGANNPLNTWNITSANSGNINSQFSFTGIQNLTGGTQGNSFLFGAAGSLSGNVVGGSTPAPGNPGINTLVYSQRNVGVTTNLQAGTSTAIGGTFSQIGALVGSSASDDTLTVAGSNSYNVWRINGANQGTVGIINSVSPLNFAGYKNLIGGTLQDDFRFSPAGFVSGSIKGGGGKSTLDYSARSTGVVVNLAAQTATSIGVGFSGISALVGSSDNKDLLIGDNNALNNWSITAGNTGNINGQFYFSGVENLTGGTHNNSYLFATGGFVSGNIIGGTQGPGNPGLNTLYYAQRNVGVITNLQNQTSTAIGGTFSQIGAVVGSSAKDDTLTGTNGNNIWNLSGLNQGTVGIVNGVSPLSFTDYKNLVGGSGSDAFKFASTSTPAGVTPWLVSGTINGGLGFNTLDYSLRTDAISVNLITTSASLVSGGFSNIQNLIGSTPPTKTYNKLYGANVNTDWNITGVDTGNLNGSFYYSSMQSLIGGYLGDAFHFMPGGSVTGVVDGGSGANSLDYTNFNKDVTVNLQSNTATGIGVGYVNISNLIGSTFNDTLVGANIQLTSSSQTIWNITGRNTGNVNGTINFTGFSNLVGGSKDTTTNPKMTMTVNNVFRMFAGALITGKIDGNNGGNNWLDYSAFPTQVTVNLAAGFATSIGSIVNIKNVHGGHGVNTLTGNYQGNALIGGPVADTIIAGSGTGQNLIIGGAGADVVKGTSGAVDSKGNPVGNSGQDIVIGGFTNYDNNLVALASILDEWQSPTSFDTRVQHLRTGGGLNQGNVLVADVTVHTDGAANAITGGKPERNWLWGQPSEFTDLTSADLYDTPIVNPPVLTGASSQVFTVGQSAIAVNPVITITDPGHSTLTSATVQITPGSFVSSQDALGFVPSSLTGNIKGSFSSTTGILTLTSLNSTATVAQFQTALRSVAYWNSSTTPSLVPRTVVFQVYDGFAYSDGLSSSVGINFAPALGNGGTSITYSASQAPTVINSGITVSDANNYTLSSATVSLSYLFFPLEDVLGFVGNASTGNITGSYNSTTGVLTLTSVGALATVANFQAALRLVTYSNISATPSLFSRTVTYQVNDGVAVSNSVASTVVVQ